MNAISPRKIALVGFFFSLLFSTLSFGNEQRITLSPAQQAMILNNVYVASCLKIEDQALVYFCGTIGASHAPAYINPVADQYSRNIAALILQICTLPDPDHQQTKTAWSEQRFNCYAAGIRASLDPTLEKILETEYFQGGIEQRLKEYQSSPIK